MFIENAMHSVENMSLVHFICRKNLFMNSITLLELPNKAPQTRVLKNREVYFLIVLESRGLR